MAGVLVHAREITAVCCQWVNSYKRLVPGFEAPVFVSWGRHNRSSLLRVPMYKPNKPARRASSSAPRIPPATPTSRSR